MKTEWNVVDAMVTDCGFTLGVYAVAGRATDDEYAVTYPGADDDVTVTFRATAAAPVGGTAARPAVRPAVPPAPVMPTVLPVGAQAIQIPSLQVSAPASPESVTAGALGVPGDPAHVGWWMPSTSELIIDGHVDMEGVGPGALYEVRNLRPGARITVQTTAGAEHWTIDGVRTYQKGRVPAGLLTPPGTGTRLVIITCGGPFDYATHHYDDNVVAYGSGG